MKYLPNAPKSPVKFWGIVLGIPMTFIVIIIFMFIYQGSTRPILDVANKFNPGVGWKLESERVEPPRIVCLNSVSCPSVHRVWVTENNIEKIDMVSYLKEAGWSQDVKGDCVVHNNVSGTGTSVCEMSESVINGFSTTVRLIKSVSNTRATLVLEINK